MPRIASIIYGRTQVLYLGDEPEDLFSRAADNWRPEGWLAQLGWIQALGHEGGLFFTIGRRM